MPSGFLTVNIHADTVDELREIVRTRPYDFGCKASVLSTDKGDYILPALLTQEQYDEVKQSDRHIEIVFENLPSDPTGRVTIGAGDRFNSGKILPQGLGSRKQGASYDLGGIMNVDEINSAMQATAEGSGGGGGMVGGHIDPNLYHVYFTAGVHANERGGPDNLIYFISDLLYSQKHGTDLHYGAKSYSNAEVLRALSTGIVFFPLVNPDGVRWDQMTDSNWRKNRNPASATPGDDLSMGVDINRNYEFLWDYRRYFDTSVTRPGTNLSSDNPHDRTFH
ncbi:hypothetical protein H2201_009258, partial [Coniosporium apollinis]